MKFSRILFGLLAMVSFATAAGIDEANKLFQSRDFAGAVSGYQKIAATEGPSAAVFYNLGNSHYRLGQYGPAILAYERAKLLAPRDPDLQANLNLARKAATVFDKSALDPRLEAVVGYLSLNEWSWLVAGAALWIGVLSVVAGVVRISKPVARRLSLGSIVFSGILIAAGTTALVLRRDEAERGVMLSKDAAIRLSPFEKADAVGTPGAGRIVRMGAKNGGYFHVEVPGTELRGWVSETDVARIAEK
ncbi:MAG: tetratricopeptide repeat protein [Luteolibacter sp.]